MHKLKLTNIIDILIKVLIVTFILLSIWFIGIKNTLSNPESYDIRTLSSISGMLLFLIIIKFVFKKNTNS
ncbi:hypothetical protein GOQ27_07890 [Clostridium sp. D2Q-11]|uniref:Uncharacterized protein n=1 Tax=Anaeromonas frigoriresistens TaxID=2683708 RepID=A0A942V1Q0_9FIRM|nr:hypothetical protein [Anaeromonas frigoriresistens]MBS4538382.1 hypothetical protein [Anaeromonas frigoriresistens]